MKTKTKTKPVAKADDPMVQYLEGVIEPLYVMRKSDLPRIVEAMARSACNDQISPVGPDVFVKNLLRAIGIDVEAK